MMTPWTRPSPSSTQDQDNKIYRPFRMPYIPNTPQGPHAIPPCYSTETSFTPADPLEALIQQAAGLSIRTSPEPTPRTWVPPKFGNNWNTRIPHLDSQSPPPTTNFNNPSKDFAERKLLFEQAFASTRQFMLLPENYPSAAVAQRHFFQIEKILNAGLSQDGRSTKIPMSGYHVSHKDRFIQSPVPRRFNT